MNDMNWLWCDHLETVRKEAIPEVSLDHWRQWTLELASGKCRLLSLTALAPPAGGAPTHLLAIVGRDTTGQLGLLKTPAVQAYESLTTHCPQAHLFERELFESWGIEPLGHPWLKPVRYPMTRHDGASNPERRPAGVIDPYQVHGEQVHEVAVGPVHAGVIEPGHFRFQCHGEKVFHLEIALGYQHRGIERRLHTLNQALRAHQIETIAGDTSVGHMTAYCHAVEALSAAARSESGPLAGGPLAGPASGLAPSSVPIRAHVIRALALELERSANHVGDLGALAADVGFLPTQAYCGRLRGDYLNLTSLVCGNRFGRGLVVPGGTAWDLDIELAQRLRTRLVEIFADVKGAVELMFETPSVRARFEGTGIVGKEDAKALGLVGVAARASGRARDARWDHPSGAWRLLKGAASVRTSGDVLARAMVRWMELKHSHEWMLGWLDNLPEGPVCIPCGPLAADSLVVSLLEGWRGEILHLLHTDAEGNLAGVKVVDPSFHNWSALAMALRGGEISDFPLCNKSFNLSYCGFDM